MTRSGGGQGAWNSLVNGQMLPELVFEFLVSQRSVHAPLRLGLLIDLQDDELDPAVTLVVLFGLGILDQGARLTESL
jgi:hypothetical protein